MSVIKHITIFNKDFGKDLEEILLEHVPDLHAIEIKINRFIYGGVMLDYEEMQSILRKIAIATEAVPSYQVTLSGVPGLIPKRVLSWDREDIMKERFAYLKQLGHKIKLHAE